MVYFKLWRLNLFQTRLTKRIVSHPINHFLTHSITILFSSPREAGLRRIDQRGWIAPWHNRQPLILFGKVMVVTLPLCAHDMSDNHGQPNQNLLGNHKLFQFVFPLLFREQLVFVCIVLVRMSWDELDTELDWV